MSENEISRNDSVIVADAHDALAPVASPRTMQNRRAAVHHIALPLIFLFVALIGGIRFSGTDGSVVFLTPVLICLVFAAALMILFFRAGLIRIDGWVSEGFSITQNLSNGITLAALFFASVQLFNSLIPEQGLPFWVISFCFLWTLWNNLFAELDTKRLLHSLAALFCFAFVAKYLVLANLAKPANEGWLSSIINNPGQTAMTWLLDIPQFSAATGYVQFFTLALFVIALYFLPPTIEE